MISGLKVGGKWPNDLRKNWSTVINRPIGIFDKSFGSFLAWGLHSIERELTTHPIVKKSLRFPKDLKSSGFLRDAWHLLEEEETAQVLSGNKISFSLSSRTAAAFGCQFLSNKKEGRQKVKIWSTSNALFSPQSLQLGNTAVLHQKVLLFLFHFQTLFWP